MRGESETVARGHRQSWVRKRGTLMTENVAKRSNKIKTEWCPLDSDPGTIHGPGETVFTGSQDINGGEEAEGVRQTGSEPGSMEGVCFQWEESEDA